MEIRPIEPGDRAPLAELLGRIDSFRDDEVDVALELIDDAIARPDASGYQATVAVDDGRVVGYACFGPTPMTAHTFDLYWVAVDQQLHGRGIGRVLVDDLMARIRAAGGRIVRIETSSQDAYDGTVAFYERLGFRHCGRIEEFYGPGDDLLILVGRT